MVNYEKNMVAAAGDPTLAAFFMPIFQRKEEHYAG